MNSSFSEYRNVNIGLPQGPNLTPLLLIIYLINAVPALSTFLFDDDTNTTLFLSHNSYPRIINTFNNDLIKVENYMISNRLSNNADNTTALMFSNRPYQIDHSLHLILDNRNISFQDSTNFVGIIVDVL